jgi:hypothetical protein
MMEARSLYGSPKPVRNQRTIEPPSAPSKAIDWYSQSADATPITSTTPKKTTDLSEFLTEFVRCGHDILDLYATLWSLDAAASNIGFKSDDHLHQCSITAARCNCYLFVYLEYRKAILERLAEIIESANMRSYPARQLRYKKLPLRKMVRHRFDPIDDEGLTARFHRYQGDIMSAETQGNHHRNPKSRTLRRFEKDK